MQKILKICFYLLALPSFVGCWDGLWDVKVTGRYYLTATDYVEEDRTLSFRIDNGAFVGVVPAMVYEVAYNDRYIFAKQYPYPVDKLTTNYYIVPIYTIMTYFPEKGVIGPLNLNDFNKKCSELNVKTPMKFESF